MNSKRLNNEKYAERDGTDKLDRLQTWIQNIIQREICQESKINMMI